MSAAEALAPEQSASEVRESLSVTEKGQPANTIGNCRTVFCHDPLLRGAIRLNLLTETGWTLCGIWAGAGIPAP